MKQKWLQSQSLPIISASVNNQQLQSLCFFRVFRTFRVFEQLLASELSPAMAIAASVHPTAAFIDRSSLIATNYRFFGEKNKEAAAKDKECLALTDVKLWFSSVRIDPMRFDFFQDM